MDAYLGIIHGSCHMYRTYFDDFSVSGNRLTRSQTCQKDGFGPVLCYDGDKIGRATGPLIKSLCSIELQIHVSDR